MTAPLLALFAGRSAAPVGPRPASAPGKAPASPSAGSATGGDATFAAVFTRQLGQTPAAPALVRVGGRAGTPAGREEAREEPSPPARTSPAEAPGEQASNPPPAHEVTPVGMPASAPGTISVASPSRPGPPPGDPVPGPIREGGHGRPPATAPAPSPSAPDGAPADGGAPASVSRPAAVVAPADPSAAVTTAVGPGPAAAPPADPPDTAGGPANDVPAASGPADTPTGGADSPPRAVVAAPDAAARAPERDRSAPGGPTPASPSVTGGQEPRRVAGGQEAQPTAEVPVTDAAGHGASAPRSTGPRADAGVPLPPPAPAGGAPSAAAPPPEGEAAPTLLAQRIADAVELLEHAPPPRRLTVELGELRLSVSLRGDTVRVTCLAGLPNAAGELARELTQALAARGLHFGGLAHQGADLAGGQGNRGDDRGPRQQSPPDAPPPTRRRPATRRTPRPAAPGVQL